MLSKKKALKYLALFIFMELAAVLFITCLFDPFYQYHGPLWGESVLYDRDNQVPGTIRTFSYDSVLLGSSVSENFDTDIIDTYYDCHTLKIIRASGSAADLLYYLEQAHENQDIKQVFWCMDISALSSSPQVTLYSSDTPRYLHTSTFLDDFTYLFNKDILFMEIPKSLAYSHLGTNTGGNAYNWSGDKNFSASQAMEFYDKPRQHSPEQLSYSDELPDIEQNISMVIEEINAHPDTLYTVFFPPYSMLWWDCGYVNGIAGEYFYVLESIFPELLACDNVELYYFQSEQDIICNLDLYMDMIHYAPSVNQYMLENIIAGEYLVTSENAEDTLQKMRDTYNYIITEGIYLYYPAD